MVSWRRPLTRCRKNYGSIRSGDQTSVLRQMYWNDRLHVQIETCLITQAAAIVEIELKGTLTRPRPGAASSSRGQWCRALQAASGKSQPGLHSYCRLGQATGVSVAARGYPCYSSGTELPLCVACSWRREGFWCDSANNSFDRSTLTATALLPGNS
jgi:hypothetical protein